MVNIPSESKWFEENKPSDETAQVEHQCKEAFRKTIITHYNSAVTKPHKVNVETTGLADIPRLEALYTLLEWDDAGRKEADKTYLGLEDAGDQQKWCRRHVLPHPQVVAGKKEPSPVELVDESSRETCSDS